MIVALSIAGLFAVTLLVPKIVHLFYKMFNGEDIAVLLSSTAVILALTFGPVHGIGSEFLAKGEKKRAERLAGYEKIAANPGKWLAEQLKAVPDPTVGGVLLVIDRKIDEIRKDSSNADEAMEIMEYGRAIDVLEERKECVRRLKSPVMCADIG